MVNVGNFILVIIEIILAGFIIMWQKTPTSIGGG